MTDRRTDGQTGGRTDGGDCNNPVTLLKKRGDKYYITVTLDWHDSMSWCDADDKYGGTRVGI